MTRDASSSGYSGTPLPKKLGLAAGQAALLVGAPEGHPESWGELPEGFAFTRSKQPSRLDLIVAFQTSAEALARELPELLASLADTGTLWIAWPKKTPAKGYPRIETDLTEDRIRDAALPLGLVDVKVCAIDGSWSGLKLMVRRELRAEPQKASTRTRSPRSTKRTA